LIAGRERGRTSVFVLGIAAWALLSLPASAQNSDSPPFTEYEVKAGFIYNFAKFVEWPETTPATIALCIVGEDPFGAARNTMDGKAIDARKLEVRSAAMGPDLRHCQIVFLATAQSGLLPQLLEITGKLPILTIGDQEGLAGQGVIISFYRDTEKVRFEINVDAAKRAGLPISSKLLNLARIVHDPKAGA
jgi:hypothetical protein